MTVYYDPFPYWDNGVPDWIGRIIDEYRELRRHPIPLREDFVKEHNSEHFGTEELNRGDHKYFIPGIMTETAETIRAKYNSLIDSDPNSEYGLVISSGYRNPRRNDRLPGSSPRSKHQWGRALDLVPGRLPPNMTRAQAIDKIFQAADESYPNDYIYIGGGHSHVHIGRDD